MAHNCIRCKKTGKFVDFCQSCKSELLPYYERTKDWQLAHDLELANERVSRYSSDREVNGYYY